MRSKMVMSFIIFALGALLSWLSIMWAVVFWLILRDGQATLIEPSMPILITEFAVAICLTMSGVAAMFYAFIKRKEEKSELSGVD